MNRFIFTAVYAAMLAIANIAAVKVVSINGWTVTAGILPIAIAFLMSDILAEKHGTDVAHKAVWAGVAALVTTIGLTQIVVALPGESVVDDVFSASLPILLASLTTVVVSQHIDVYLFAQIRDRLPYKATRNIGSTTLSQLLDTAAFTLLAFQVYPAVLGGTTLPIAAITTIVVTEWVVKVGLSITDTPVFYALTR